MAETWIDKWKTVRSRWETCQTECWRGHEQIDDTGQPIARISAQKCKDSIEALAQDLWALRDWLVHDSGVQLSQAIVDGFLDSSDGYHVRACSDLATRLKHFRVGDKRKHLLELVRVDQIKGGAPIVFRAVRLFQHALEPGEKNRALTGSSDEYEDAVEMVRRAIIGWESFFTKNGIVFPK